MSRASHSVSDEAQALNTQFLRVSGEDTEHHHRSYEESRSPTSPLTSTTSCRTHPGGQGEASPVYTPVERQHQPQFGVQHQGSKDSSQNDSFIQRLWLWEMLSIAVAALCLAAIVITLVLRRDRPLPKLPSAITINALIAIFTAIFKACLMMPIAECIGQLKWLWYQKSRPLRHMEQWDLASRGPWGSLLLIFVLNSRNLAVIGAILTIVAMAVDPFTQQIVQVYNCLRVIEGQSATVPFSNNYTAGTTGRPSLPPTADPQMRVAIYSGLLDPPVNVSAVLDFECMTGNCTFPSTEDGATFLSVALESRCADIRSNISISVDVSTDTNYDNETLAKLYPMANASLFDYGIYIDNTSVFWPLRSGYKRSHSAPSTFLRKIAFLMAPGVLELEYAQAFECEFYPVVNTYSANVTNGVLLEQVLDSQRLDGWPMGVGLHAMSMLNKTIRAGEWHECTSSEERSDEHDTPIYNSPYPKGPNLATSVLLDHLPNKSSSYYGTTLSDIKWWPQDCIYSIEYEPNEGLAASLSEFLGNESVFWDLFSRAPVGNLWSLNLWREGSATLETVQAAMDGLTRSVTARWRQGDGISDNIGPVVGLVWGNQTCVRVNWAWIALPASLLLLTINFLFLTIVKTRSKKAHVWKSSIFAVLFSGLEQEIRKFDGPVVSLEDMKAAADRATVRLEDTKDGVRLVSQA